MEFHYLYNFEKETYNDHLNKISLQLGKRIGCQVKLIMDNGCTMDKKTYMCMY